MDYNLFQSDDEDDILTAFEQATQSESHVPPPATIDDHDDDHMDDDGVAAVDVLPEFNCGGRDMIKWHQDFQNNGFIRNGYKLGAQVPRTRLDNLCFPFEEQQLQVASIMRSLHATSCMNIQKLCGAVQGQVKSNISCSSLGGWFRARQQVTHYYYWLLHGDHGRDIWQNLSPLYDQLRALLNKCLDADMWRALYLEVHNKGNDCQSPGYHLYHGANEWRLLDLCVEYRYQALTPDETGRQLAYQEQLERILNDLVLCASYHYRSKHAPELISSSAFTCRCIREVWLLLQRHHADKQSVEFWPMLHRTMQRHKAQLKLEQQQQQQQSLTLAYHEFYAWLRLNLVRLATPDDPKPSGELYLTASLMKQFLASQPSEQQRRIYICLLAPLQLHYAQPDTEVLCQLWDCLHRSLNCYFTTDASKLDQLPMLSDSGASYLERYRLLLEKPQLEDLNLSSFTLFALLLGKTLQQLSTLGRSHQVQKLIGRILSKFSVAKLLALNEPGIHHVIELFLCMLLPYRDYVELPRKLREMMLGLALDKLPPARRHLVAKGHMAMLLLQAQRRQPLHDYAGKLFAQLAAVCNDATVGGIYAGSLHTIFELADDFTLGEHALIGPWLSHYLQHGGVVLDRVFEALHLVCQKLRATGQTTKDQQLLWQALQQHVLPQLRVQYVSSCNPWLPQLAADLVLLNTSETKKLLESLLLGLEPINTAASAQLLLHVLRDQQSSALSPPPPPDSLIIQVWLKSLVLLNPQHESVVQLTAHVVQLEEFRALGLDAACLENREPLCTFFGALGRRAQQLLSSGEANHRMRLSNKFHAYVAQFEHWQHAEQQRPGPLPGRPELGARFYNFLAIVIYNCGLLAYVRAKPSCFFHLAMTRFLLTNQLQAGVPPEGRQPQLVHRIFPVLLQGIGRLPYQADPYLTYTLEKLLLNWTPHFGFSKDVAVVVRPYAMLLQAEENIEFSKYVFKVLCQQFLAVQRSKPGKYAGMIIAMLQQLFTDVAAPGAAGGDRQLLLLLQAVNLPLLEHVMFVGELEASRVQLLELYRRLFKQSRFQQSSLAQESFSGDIRDLVNKHMAHGTYFFFQMLIKLAELSPPLIAPTLSFVRQEALNVELKRGAGQDVGIRKCITRLEQALLL